MYHLQNFLGNRFDRIQAIIDNEHSQMNLYANLIGSANYSFPSVLEALNTPFNLNPSEGSRRKRYFPQCNSIDELEKLKEYPSPDMSFDVDYVNSDTGKYSYTISASTNNNIITFFTDNKKC